MIKRIVAVFGCVLALLSLVVVPSFADDSFQSITPIEFNDFSGSLEAVAFPGSNSLPLITNTTVYRDYLYQGDYHNNNGVRVKYGDLYGNGSSVPYIQIYLVCNYQSVYVNSVSYNASDSASSANNNPINLLYVDRFVCYPAQASYGNTSHYVFNIVLGIYGDYNSGYQVGFEEGKVFGYNEGYQNGLMANPSYDEAYSAGYEAGIGEISSGEWGANLLGDTLSAPIKALNKFVIVTTPSGYDITLGLVVGCTIALTLFLAFLKLFAGG